jgi:N-acyl-D-amino-acid deacylase
MLDVLIKGGKIIDGSGGKPYFADVAVKDGVIVEICPAINKESKITIYSAGYVDCHGFTDIHSHSGFSLLHNPRAESKVMQGITTEVMGDCGFSPAPVNEDHFGDLIR